MLVDEHGAGRERGFGGEISRQLADAHADEPDRPIGGGVVDRRDRGDRLAAIAHLVARERMLAARDRQHAEGLVAVGTGDDGLDAGQLERRRDVDLEDLAVGVGAAVDAARQHVGREQVGGIFRPPGDLVRPVDHRHIAADVAGRHDFVHGATPVAWRPAAYFTASMIFT